MNKIFISYRRSDSEFPSDAIYRELIKDFGKEAVFKDVDNIPLGKDFKSHLEQAVAQCVAMLVVIGPNWLDTRDERGQRRIDNPTDLVRIEIVAALQRDIAVIPLLLGSTPIPSPEQLPDVLQNLSMRQGICIRPAADFDRDMGRLITQLKSLIPLKKTVETSMPKSDDWYQPAPISPPRSTPVLPSVALSGFPKRPINVTDNNFDQEVLRSPIPVLVDLWAEWCGPCRAVQPILEEIAVEYQGRVKVVKMDVDENHQIPAQLGVRGIPTLVLFKNGKEVKRQIGAGPKQLFVKMITE